MLWGKTYPIAVNWCIQVTNGIPVSKEHICWEDTHSSVIILEELHAKCLEKQTVDKNPHNEETQRMSYSCNAWNDEFNEHAKSIEHFKEEKQLDCSLCNDHCVHYGHEHLIIHVVAVVVLDVVYLVLFNLVMCHVSWVLRFLKHLHHDFYFFVSVCKFELIYNQEVAIEVICEEPHEAVNPECNLHDNVIDVPWVLKVLKAIIPHLNDFNTKQVD